MKKPTRALWFGSHNLASNVRALLGSLPGTCVAPRPRHAATRARCFIAAQAGFRLLTLHPDDICIKE